MGHLCTFSASIAVTLTLLNFVDPAGASVQCYQCLYNCDDVFDPIGYKASTVYCESSCTKVKNNAGRVIRGCNPTYVRDGCKVAEQVDICYCSTDLCNGGPSQNAPLAAMILYLLPITACIVFIINWMTYV